MTSLLEGWYVGVGRRAAGPLRLQKRDLNRAQQSEPAMELDSYK